MITPVSGNLLADDAEALVNPVNCVGVMGKGLALQFKRAYPHAFEAYAVACREGRVRIGIMHVYGGFGREPRIIHFPTKDHWRDPSNFTYIELGLSDLARVIKAMSLTSIAIPALGVGLGGLPWPDVEELIHEYLDPLTDVDIRLYAPQNPERPK